MTTELTYPFLANDPPPAYSPASDTNTNNSEDPYAFLSNFDTIFLIDDLPPEPEKSHWEEAMLASCDPHTMIDGTSQVGRPDRKSIEEAFLRVPMRTRAPTITIDTGAETVVADDDETALRLDPGSEKDFEVENNPFAFSPGQLNKLFHPKSLGAFYALGGLDGIEKGLNVDREFFNTASDWTTYRRNYFVLPISDQHVPCRRGRGKRRNEAFWRDASQDESFDPFDNREMLFADQSGSLKRSRLVNLDTQLKIDEKLGSDLIMSRHCMEGLDLQDRMSTDFEDPQLQSISGHDTAVIGLLRNVEFRLKGTSITYRGDFWVCDAINELVDIMIGARFIKDHLKSFFGSCVKACRSLFAPWFSKKKETKDEEAEREERQREQRIRANELEIRRLQRENEEYRQRQGGAQS